MQDMSCNWIILSLIQHTVLACRILSIVSIGIYGVQVSILCYGACGGSDFPTLSINRRVLIVSTFLNDQWSCIRRACITRFTNHGLKWQVRMTCWIQVIIPHTSCARSTLPVGNRCTLNCDIIEIYWARLALSTCKIPGVRLKITTSAHIIDGDLRTLHTRTNVDF